MKKIEASPFGIAISALLIALLLREVAQYFPVLKEAALWMEGIADLILYITIAVLVIREIVLFVKGMIDEDKCWRIFSAVRFGLMAITLGIIVYIEATEYATNTLHSLLERLL